MDSGPSPWTAWYSAWLSLNIHLHMLFVDGVYTFEGERPRFHHGAAPTQAELQRLLHAIATRVTRALEKQGLLTRDEENPSLDIEPADDFEQLLGAAVHYRIATGPHAGRKALTLRTVGSNPPPDNPCIAQLSGFSLHAGTVCEAHERDALERLCRYIARPAVSNERLSVNDRGQVVYRLKHSFRDGTTHVVLDPIDFIARLAAPEVPLAQRARSVPRPRAHLTRYHGVFAPNCKHRHRIIPNPAHQSAREPHPSRRASPPTWRGDGRRGVAAFKSMPCGKWMFSPPKQHVTRSFYSFVGTAVRGSLRLPLACPEVVGGQPIVRDMRISTELVLSPFAPGQPHINSLSHQ